MCKRGSHVLTKIAAEMQMLWRVSVSCANVKYFMFQSGKGLFLTRGRDVTALV